MANRPQVGRYRCSGRRHDERWQPGDGQQLQAWAKKVYSESEEPIEERIYDLPSRLNRAILAGDYKKCPVTLPDRRDRHAMETGAEQGHTGEEAWAIMTMDGAECVSSGVHILGFFVGHMG